MILVFAQTGWTDENPSVRSMYKGEYDNVDDALASIVGSRGVINRIELLDLSTNGFTEYLWHPTFNHHAEIYRYGDGDDEVECVEYLTLNDANHPYDDVVYRDDNEANFHLLSKMGKWITLDF